MVSFGAPLLMAVELARGTAYRVDPAGAAIKLHNFIGGPDGGNPYSGVLRDSAGNFYGTAYNGGTTGGGTIFKLSLQ